MDRAARQIAVEPNALARAGARINTFVLAATVARLVRLVAWARPDWHGGLSRGLDDPEGMDHVYRVLAPANFSREVLERVVPSLRLAPIGDVGWTDIGTPDRLERTFGAASALAAR